MSFYQIEYSKKDNGWVTKRQDKNYKYARVANSPAHSTIEEAEKWIEENDKDRPWIDHKIEGHSGKLFSLEDWKECCDAGGFIDYDGYGNAVDENYKIIDMGKVDDFFDEMISPSDYTIRGGVKIPLDTKYILWYNR